MIECTKDQYTGRHCGCDECRELVGKAISLLIRTCTLCSGGVRLCGPVLLCGKNDPTCQVPRIAEEMTKGITHAKTVTEPYIIRRREGIDLPPVEPVVLTQTVKNPHEQRVKIKKGKGDKNGLQRDTSANIDTAVK